MASPTTNNHFRNAERLFVQTKKALIDQAKREQWPARKLAAKTESLAMALEHFKTTFDPNMPKEEYLRTLAERCGVSPEEAILLGAQVLRATSDGKGKPCSDRKAAEALAASVSHPHKVQETATQACWKCELVPLELAGELCQNDLLPTLDKMALAQRNMLLKCANCRIAMYCSKNCQRAHWPTHKSVCKIFGQLTTQGHIDCPGLDPVYVDEIDY